MEPLHKCILPFHPRFFRPSLFLFLYTFYLSPSFSLPEKILFCFTMDQLLTLTDFDLSSFSRDLESLIAQNTFSRSLDIHQFLQFLPLFVSKYPRNIILMKNLFFFLFFLLLSNISSKINYLHVIVKHKYIIIDFFLISYNKNKNVVLIISFSSQINPIIIYMYFSILILFQHRKVIQTSNEYIAWSTFIVENYFYFIFWLNVV